ncbi:MULTISPECIES: SDR family NAD(P)-dependent oxidoreductase [Rhodanobacteraceae]|jgi:NAD(P)-dependent dehydrogenase (short-subunit alcohol dehydrogenase family)|uniref:SDR family NAD(P)-dependent oxidoreductase n=1 Tax=Rhodanobacteraceae TaxID=1775411 RepID=UPI000569F03D|nr:MULTISPECIES: SDR family oxidoreductase [Rhodanobacteraceae]SDG76301.1 NAD(P)-dependent dehydrogenase, short-chain alcohol dehydrogenase family [Dyella sp. 333MFSha]
MTSKDNNSARRIAVVTGGSRGLGRATVLALARRGVDSVFTYQSRRADAEAVVAAVADLGSRAMALPLDVGVASSFGAFATELASTLSSLGADRFDYLVNNAGISLHKAFAETTEAELDAVFNVHFKGTFLLSQTLLPLIRDGGRIVNLSSGLARVSAAPTAAYGAMKAAVESLTRYMAKELGPRGITVNAVAPGAIATDFSGGMVRDNPEVQKMVIANTALARIGQPDDIGEMIAALLGDENRWVNGQRIEVAGGMAL